MGGVCKANAKTHNEKSANTISQSRNSGCCRTANSPVEKIKFFQRTAGNQAVQRLIKSGALQTKLRIGQPNDAYEKEADRVAEKVMSIPELKVQRQAEKDGEEENIQAKQIAAQITPLVQRQSEEMGKDVQGKGYARSSPDVSSNLEDRIQNLKWGGQPLSRASREFFEPRFGYDFSKVRVHTSTEAAEILHILDAKAYTVGNHMVLGDEQYAPTTVSGKRLLAHELTHVIQQKNQKTSFRIQRKLALYSKEEAKSFNYLLTKNDATYFQYQDRQNGSLEVIIKSVKPTKIEDTFRFNILKMIIDNPSEKLVIRKYGMDEKVTPHQLFKNGKVIKTGIRSTLRQMSKNILGAGGVYIPSENLALSSDSEYTGPVTGIKNESWIIYSEPSSLAHEFGHAFLSFSHTSSGHGGKVPKSKGIITPEGEIFEGSVNVFISKFVEEKFAELTLIDPEALHFSPTTVRKWPEPPYFKLTFTGTWLQFLAKYPGSTVKQKIITKEEKKIRSLTVCIPKPGQLCLQ